MNVVQSKFCGGSRPREYYVIVLETAASAAPCGEAMSLCDWRVGVG